MDDRSPDVALGVLLGFADRDGLDAAVRRMPELCAAALTASRVPLPELVDTAAASDHPAVTLALARLPYTPVPVRLRLARRGDARLAAALFRGSFPDGGSDLVREAVLGSADPADPHWFADDGLVASHLLGPGLDYRARVFEEWTDGAGPTLEYAPAIIDLVPALTTRLPTLRATAFRELAYAMIRPPEDYAAADTTGRTLRRLLAAGYIPASRSVAELSRAGGVEAQVAASLTEGPLDWAVVREHRALGRLDDRVLAFLAARADCPANLLDRLFDRSPWETLAVARRIPLDMFRRPGLRQYSDEWRSALRRHLESGALDARQVLAALTPAHEVAAALPQESPAVREALRAQAARLGGDPRAWRRLAYTGTAAQVTVVGAVDDAAGPTAAAEPEPTPEHPADWPSVDEERDRYPLLRALFPHLAPQHQNRVLEHLDVALLRALLADHRSGELHDLVIETRAGTAVAAEAACGRLTRASVARLLGLDDPRVNAALYTHADLTYAQRLRVLSGRDRTGRPGALPVADAVAAYLPTTRPKSPFSWASAAMVSGNPVAVRTGLRAYTPRTTALWARIVSALWESHGPGHVELLLDEFAPERTPAAQRWTRRPVSADSATIRRALHAPEGPAGFRATCAREHPPQLLVDAMAGSGPGSEQHNQVNFLMEWGPPSPADWAALAAARQAGRLTTSWNTTVLATHGAGLGHPAEVVEAALRPALAVVYRPLGALARDVYGDGFHIAARIPARAALLLYAHADADVAADGGATRCAVRDTLRDNPDAWAAAAALLPDFTGTLLELLETAERMTTRGATG
ncbi:hypothetical protein [Embleya hyalina]|uniref:Uncharacterized protein n=1 Tax=Embleya hyalina TaxID=516124 RepID=A0A401Z648_9ACTN|nr:hypothetical protein [Embleya hyalina]GCE02313.1 hypothetical protein EHYA_10090 [Embleya hyalina]